MANLSTEDEVAQSDPPPSKAAGKRRMWVRWIFGLAALLLILLLTIGYWQRVNIAGRFAEDQIKKYNIRASYQIKDIGLRTQRIENIVVGDPANPDFTAKWVEIDVALNFSGVTVRDVRANGVKINGRYDGKKLSFGELDKFTDPDSKEPFEIPDIGVDLSDAQMSLDTPWGRIGAGLDGEGLLRQRFEGNLALRAPLLQYQDCRFDAAAFDGRYLLDFRRPNLIGPWTAQSVSCNDSEILAKAPTIDGDLRLNAKFDRWFGDVNYSLSALSVGEQNFIRPRGALSFAGGGDRTNFDVRLADGGYESAQLNAQSLGFDAKGHLDFGDGGFAVTARGDANIGGGKVAASYLTGMDALAQNSKATPAGPLVAQLIPAVKSGVNNFDARLRFDADVRRGGSSSALIDGINIRSRSGIRLTQSGATQLTQRGDIWRVISPLRLSLSGGNMPVTRIALRQGAGDSWSGDIAVDPYAAGRASLSIPALAFNGRPGGAWTFDGRAKLSGPLPQGFVNGVNFALNGRYDAGRLSLYNSCQSVSFDRIQYNLLVLSKQNLRICPDGGYIVQTGTGTQVKATLPSMQASGSYGGSRFDIRTGQARFDLARGFTAADLRAAYGDNPIRIAAPVLRFNFDTGFDTKNVRVEAGSMDALTYFEIAALNGSFASGGMRGRLSGANGKIANVPVMMTDASGDWTLVDGDVALQARLDITDSEANYEDSLLDQRFEKLNIPNALITFEGGIINGLAEIYEPTTATKIADLDLRHDLNGGEGRALLAVDNLVFNERLTPELLTPVTRGLVQNVAGPVFGDARIEWDTNEDGIISTGRFGTTGIDLAAAFGPVRGLKTELLFTDLLALETAPGQIARIDTINPGVAALDGIVRYRLLAGRKVQIEGGSWPFAGGELSIEPTVWDMSVDKPRYLVLDVKGVEVGQFIEQFDFDNLAATGVFDGKLPMVFDFNGGKIVGGELIARSGGGNISYIGDLTYMDLNAYANFAFDALRSIDYTGLRIEMGGDLGGEIITNINFDGIKQGAGAKRNFITRQLADIPIRFNIRIEASFFELMGLVRSTYDPQFLAQKNIDQIRAEQEKLLRGDDGKPE
ncbi:YdbH domain-containing protein [Sphingorhabdus arenilitoris]|uniref:YdbH domain-containing protein n=1 Tax=Sphingorhabdus arenilitoris TaxID=1490041 RepID=A0ABV8RHL9_9SPHN